MIRSISLVGIVLGLAITASAQESRGTIQGTVKDPHNALVVGASVTVVETETKTTVSLKSNDAGRYSAPLLRPGNYTVTVDAPGFKKEVHEGIALLTGDIRTVDVILQIGTSTESVTVTSETPIIDATNTTTGGTIDDRTVRDLPVMTGVATGMIQFQQGVNAGQSASMIIGPHSTGGGSDYNNGSGVGGNNWTIDGAFANGTGRSIAELPSTSSVAEVKVTDSTFDGAFGHSVGLGISFTTKSGSNDFHGTADENYWAQRWWGSNLFTKQAYYTNVNGLLAKGNTTAAADALKQPIQPGGHSNLYGFTATGPFRIPHLFDLRNKAFWSLTYNGQKDHKTENPANYGFIVPSASDKTGNFSDLLNIKSDGKNYNLFDPFSVQVDPSRSGTHYVRTPLPGNVLPASYAAMGSKYYKNYTKYWPDPNNWYNQALAQDAGTSQDDYLATNMPYNWTFGQWQGRMDLNLTSKLRAFGRYTRNHFVEYRNDWTSDIVPGYNNYGPTGTGVTRDEQNGVVDFVYTVSPSTLVHAASSVTNWMQYNTTLPYAFQFKPSDAGLPTYLDNNCGDSCYLPQMSVSGYSSNGVGGSSPPGYNRFYDANGDVYHNRGNHQFRAGVDFRQQTHVQHNGNSDGNYTFGNTYFRQYDDGGPNGNYNPATLGLSWASFMTGLPTSASTSINSSYSVSNQYFAAFLQDTWRVAPRLTLTLSLRAEWENGAQGARNNYIVGWDTTSSLPITAPAKAAYAANPIPELAASNFNPVGGSLYAGTTGAPSRMWPSELVWLPRIGVGYQLDKKTVLRGGYGIYYDTLDVNAGGNNGNSSWGLDQTGYSSSTSPTYTTTQGVTWGANGTNCGNWCNAGSTMTSPLTDPFPVRADGTRFTLPVGNVYGLMGKLATSSPWNWNGTTPDSKHPRMQRWRVGIERQLTEHDVVSFGYTGAFTSKLNVNVNSWALPSKYYYFGASRPVTSTGATVSCAAGTANATASGCLEDTNLGANVTNPFYIGNLSSIQSSNPTLYNQLSQGGTIFTSSTIQKLYLLQGNPVEHMAVGQPIGHERETELDLGLNHRFSRGLVGSVNYTYFDSRYANSFLNNWAPNDPDNPQSPVWQQNNINPHRITATWVYDLPFGKGRKWLHEKYAGAIIGGWAFSGSYVWSMGTLIGIPNAFYYGDPNKLKLDHPTLSEWFNTAGCVLSASQAGPGDTVVAAGQPCTSGWDKRSGLQPGTYQARQTPLYVDGLRNPSWGQINASLMRDFTFNLKEHPLTFSVRCDVLNVENHSYFGGANTGVTSGVGTFGAITTASQALNRFIQIQGHVRW